MELMSAVSQEGVGEHGRKRPIGDLSIVYIENVAIEPDPTPFVTAATSTTQNLSCGHANHQLDKHADLPLVTEDVNGAQAVFSYFPKLPEELRLMVWEMAIPARKTLALRMDDICRICFCETNKRLGWLGPLVSHWPRPDEQLLDKVRPPMLGQICNESRAVALKHGKFIFGRADDPGFWWNHDLDVLWLPRVYGNEMEQDITCLQCVRGLEYIKHLAIDNWVADELSYEIGYCRVEDATTLISQLEPVIIRLRHASGLEGASNPISAFFNRLLKEIRSMTIFFGELDGDSGNRPEVPLYTDTLFISDQPQPQPEDHRTCVTFQIGPWDIEKALGTIERYEQLWQSMDTEKNYGVQHIPYSETTHGPVFSVKDGFAEDSPGIKWKHFPPGNVAEWVDGDGDGDGDEE